MDKLLPLLLSLLLFWEPYEHQTIFSGVAMTVPYKIIIREKISPKEQVAIDLAIRDIFWTTHTVYNKFNPASELSYLNRLDKEICYTPSKPLMDLLKRVDTYVKTTNGLFDPTVENKEAIGWENIVLTNDHVVKKQKETALDLGGVAKGTTIDDLLSMINAKGYRSVLVEWGGDFACSTDGRPWRIELFGKDEIIDFSSGGLATSGDYQQFWKEGDQTFFHLYHPKEKRHLTQQPGHLMSVSVKASSAEEADLLATTLLLLEKEEAAKIFLQSPARSELPVWFVSR